MAQEIEITVLGAGPAAVATACALHRLGHVALLVGRPSRNAALEGVSERALSLLRNYGFEAAADSVCGPGERLGSWAGMERSGSREYVVQRADLDRALLIDATALGVRAQSERIIGYRRLGARWQVFTDRRQVQCRIVIDARGRRAQRLPCKGPTLIAVCQRFLSVRARTVLTRIAAVPHGWCWLACDGRGTGCLQVISCGKEPSLRTGLAHHLRSFLDLAPDVAASLSEAVAAGPPFVRAATSLMSAGCGRLDLVRIGDASVTLDPLSGQGIHEALKSAAVATAAARGYLAGKSAVIDRFMEERSQEIWQQNAAAAARHYGRQTLETASKFWTGAATHYQSIRPILSQPVAPRIERRPVLNGDMVELRRVIVTSRSPRGVWNIDGVDLPGLLDFLGEARTSDVGLTAQHLRCRPAAVIHALHWLRQHGLLRPQISPAPLRHLMHAERIEAERRHQELQHT